jgi:hypothetical protein
MKNQQAYDSLVRRDGPLENSYPRFTVPALADASGKAAWTWSNYVELVSAANMTKDFVASWVSASFELVMAVAGTYSEHVELALATGAAGSEVDFAVVPWNIFEGGSNFGATTLVLLGTGMTFPIAPKYIPSGTRIAMRVRGTQLGSNLGVKALAYLCGYDGGAISKNFRRYSLNDRLSGIQRGVSSVTPAGNTLPVVQGNGAFGAWKEIIAAVTGDVFVQGLLYDTGTQVVSKWAIFEFGTGPAGNEVARARMFVPMTPFGCSGFHMMPQPLLVLPGERLVVHAWSNATTTMNCQFLVEQH